MSRPFTYGSVCSGIEAATAGWHLFDWKPAFVSEIDPFPCHVLHHRLGAGRPIHMPLPNEPGISAKEKRERAAAIAKVASLPLASLIPNAGDFRHIQEGDFDPIDLLVGGTPCQDFSVAGLRKGLEGERGKLTLDFLRLVGRLRPRWMVWENVAGSLSQSKGRALGALLGGLDELGYSFAWRVLDTQHVRSHGFGRAIPQRRRRVFVVGYLGDWRRPAAVLLERACLSGDPSPRRQAGQTPSGTLTARTHGGGGLGTDLDLAGGLGDEASEEVAKTILRGGHGNNPLDENLVPEVSGDSAAREGKGMASQGYGVGTPLIPEVAHSLRPAGFDASEDGTGRGTPLIPVVSGTLESADGRRSAPPAERDKLLVVAPFDERQVTSPENRSRIEPGAPEPALSATNQLSVICTASGQANAETVSDGSPSLTCLHEAPIIAFNARQDPDSGAAPWPLDTDGFTHAIAFSAKDHGQDATEGVASTLRPGGYADSHQNGGVPPAVAYGLRSDLARDGTAKTPSPDAEGRVRLRDPGFNPLEGLAPTLDSGAPHAVAYEPVTLAVRGRGDTRNLEMRADGTANPLMTSNGGRDGIGVGAIAIPEKFVVRRLTPRECERLQGFPDDHTLIPWGKKLAPDGLRYKALGNSMSVNVMRWLGQRIQWVIENDHLFPPP